MNSNVSTSSPAKKSTYFFKIWFLVDSYIVLLLKDPVADHVGDDLVGDPAGAENVDRG